LAVLIPWPEDLSLLHLPIVVLICKWFFPSESIADLQFLALSASTDRPIAQRGVAGELSCSKTLETDQLSFA
jgi:hypothetical protein